MSLSCVRYARANLQRQVRKIGFIKLTPDSKFSDVLLIFVELVGTPV
jgi:hypothetical protein